LQSSAKNLKYASCAFLLRLLLVGVAFTMICLDVAVFHTGILEISFTEITQELMLFCCACLFWAIPTPEGEKGCTLLVAGFFASLLMRELDGLFDPISHSAWCWPFMFITIASLGAAFSRKNRRATLPQLAAFTNSSVFGSLSTALAVLVFSRVFGMGTLWHLILGAGYARLAKTTVEEGIELLTYSMWLAASLEYFWQQRAAASFRQAATQSRQLLYSR